MHANLKRFLVRAREQNLKLNNSTLKLHLPKVEYIEDLLTSEGLHTDLMKLKAIQELPRLEDKKTVKRLLWCTNYLSHSLKSGEVCSSTTDKKIQHYSTGKHSKNQHLSKSESLSQIVQFSNFTMCQMMSPFSVMFQKKILVLHCYKKVSQLPLHPVPLIRQNKHVHK